MLASMGAFAQESSDSIRLPMADQISDVEIYSTLIRDDNSISLSRKQFLTMAGALEDPTRLLIKFPGISTVNDQANSVVYHGMPAQYHRWSLYGARILNPNHLGNAGTISDFPARSSGGVNMFSGQAIGSLEFNGNPSSKSLDAISASSDMRLRNPFQNSVNTNFSLIGMEVGMDKMADDGMSSFLLNYRYSTVGLLTTLGLDFGGEVINYQDITGKYSKWLANGDELSTYFSMGYNSNVKESLEENEQPEEFKDLLETDYYSLNIVTGISYNGTRDEVDFRNTLNISINSTGRTSFNPSSSETTETEYDSDEILIASKHDYSRRRDKWKLGFTFEPYLHVISFEKYYPSEEFLGLDVQQLDRTALHLIPSVYSSYSLSDHLSVNARVGMQSVISSEQLIDAMGQGELKYSHSGFVSSLRFSRVSQVFQPEILIYGIEPDFVKGNNYEVNIGLKGFSVSGFYHAISNLPISTRSFAFSAFENLDILPLERSLEPVMLKGTGEAEVYGLSFSIVKNVGGVGIMSNLTLMDSEHLGAQESTKAPLDYGHIFNFNLTKNWEFSNGKEFGISASFHHRGGARQNLVDLSRSFNWGYTNYSFENQYQTKLEDYHRMDLRILYKPSKRSTISLDIQNVMSRENDAFFFYDALFNESRLQRQLGMIPILGWRVEW